MLRVWLPLTKDLRNQGLDDVIVTNNGATFNSAGKLGGCYSFNGSSYITVQDVVLQNIWSYSCWLYSDISSRSWEVVMTCNINGGDADMQLGLYTRPGGNIIQNTANGQYNASIPMTYGQWNHFVGTFDGANLKTYLNGVLVNTKAITNAKLDRPKLTIGARCRGSSYDCYFQGLLNDVRIYDHCLSPMEVKELAKGLVLHYPLNRQGLGPSNLIKNGFGELGTENWKSGVSVSTTDIPANQTDIKASFAGYTEEYMKIYPTHTYKFSAWIKGTATSGNTYPSLYPYDIDGKFINFYNCPDAFNLNTMTTLKQQLKAGDTKIYVNDLSQWNTNSGHYYDVAAIFSYTDSTGYTYSDGTYIQNCPAFASSTEEKTNLDKVNNIITLKSAYTGPTMPVGTKLCASTYGSTYYYPLGGIKLSTIQDWTYKEGTFSGDVGRLRYAKTVTFSTYGNNRMAGIKLEDITANTLTGTTEYDTSGYCNNGTRTGTFSWTSDTPKYSVSTYMPKAALITHPRPVFGGTDQEWTCAMWVKLDTTSQTNQNMNNFNVGNRIVYAANSYPLLYLNSGTNDYYNYGNKTVTAGAWTHVVFVFKNSNVTKLIYINGVEQTNKTGPNKTSTPLGIPDIVTVGENLAGYISDYRIYATALSASDVKSLYQNCATIDPDGTIRGQIRS